MLLLVDYYSLVCECFICCFAAITVLITFQHVFLKTKRIHHRNDVDS